MKSLTVNKLEVGMVVARDVITSKSQVLLKKGIELDDYYIKIFDRYGIEYVVIEDVQKEVKNFSDEEKKQIRFDIKNQKKQIFQNVKDDDFYAELLETVTEIRFEEYING